MKFHVAGLLKEPVGATRRHEFAEVIGRIDEDVTAAGPVEGSVKLMKTGRGILVDADLHLPVRLACGRCLSEFDLPLDLRFKEQYQPLVDVDTGLPLPEPEEGAEFRIDENHELDLSEAIRQYTLLAVPIAPVCTGACAGLCSHCGKNLNEGPCECGPQSGDERLAALADYLKAVDSGEEVGAVARPHGKRKHKR